jgi:hypothetical protein
MINPKYKKTTWRYKAMPTSAEIRAAWANAKFKTVDVPNEIVPAEVQALNPNPVLVPVATPENPNPTPAPQAPFLIIQDIPANVGDDITEMCKKADGTMDDKKFMATIIIKTLRNKEDNSFIFTDADQDFLQTSALSTFMKISNLAIDTCGLNTNAVPAAKNV